MTEKRRHPRSHVLRRALIVFRRGYGTLDCVVLDLSTGGARLKIGDWLGLPERFQLRIDNGLIREAELCARDLDVARVRFVDQVAA